MSCSESLRDFVCENEFDSFGAREDRKAAASRSLESIASMWHVCGIASLVL